jgi:hypothetical protein
MQRGEFRVMALSLTCVLLGFAEQAKQPEKEKAAKTQPFQAGPEMQWPPSRTRG